MAHHAEPMDIDDESVFDNKENTYQHSNVLPRTPCTEKGYEELDVSELNMKLRYSITPASSPMSKSMSHCLDSRNNTLADESLNNTVVNEYENNLTRSLNSTLNKTEVKLSKVLPLQALPTDIVDNNRSSILRPLDSATANDITITVSNDNEIDNLSYASSSSSMTHTPEATTPTKEIPKHDGGSPIMRGLKSVLSMFRSSQSPIPPGEEDTKAANPVVSPADVPLPESKPRAVASTPKNENTKERSLSRRNSPHKESLVFNEDLEKELQWNDDSTIVFSTEKIPIHKLFFQDKPSKSAILNENVNHESANSTVEYMDVSFNDLSVKDKTLNGTANKSKVHELAESDGEFVDCETTFTQNEANFKTEEFDALKTSDSQIPAVPENLMENIRKVNEPFTLDTTKDIINSINDSHTIVEVDPGKHIDFSTTDIVNQLSDLINESEGNATNVMDNKNTIILDEYENPLSDVQTENNKQSDLLQNEVTSPMNSTTYFPDTVTEQVSKDLVHTLGSVCDITIDNFKSAVPKINSALVGGDAVTTHEFDPQISSISLPCDDNINDIHENKLENISAELQNKDVHNPSTSQNVLVAALNKSVTEGVDDVQDKQVEAQNDITTCPPNLLPSDVPLLNTDKINTSNIPHEATTIVFDPVHGPVIEKPDNPVEVITTKDDLIDAVDKSISETSANAPQTVEAVNFDNIDNNIPYPPSLAPSDIPLPCTDDDNLFETDQLTLDAETVVPFDIQQQTIENLHTTSFEDKSANADQFIETVTIKTGEIISKVKVAEAGVVDVVPTNLYTPKEEQMEISFVESRNGNLSESIAMDVSMVDTNINVGETLDQQESCQKVVPPFNTLSEIPDRVSRNVEITPIMNTELKSDSAGIECEKFITETVNKEVILEQASANVMTKDLTDIPKSVDSLNKDASVSADLITPEYLPNPNIDKAPCGGSQLPALPEMSVSGTETNYTASDKITNHSKLNDTLEDIAEIVSGSDVTSPTIVTENPALNDQDSNILLLPTVIDENRVCDVKNNTTLPKNSDASNSSESSPKLEHTSQFTEKIDEEIVLSESNSPFISISAEEEFDPELKKKGFENTENPFLTKSKVDQSPPISPKIVSKGYNFNFDEIDTINPFATKTKIRMSPPPDASPNTSLMTEEVNKTISVVEPLKSDKTTNRRKSMPERKKPIKAKRHLNSSIDCTGNASAKSTASQNSEFKTEPQEENSQISQPNPIGKNVAVTVTQDVNKDKLDVTVPFEIITCQEKVQIDPEVIPSSVTTLEEKVQREPEGYPSDVIIYDEKVNKEPDATEDISIRTVDETNAAQIVGSKVIEDVVKSASSSEQSTYYSADVSSTELTDSKNVFNLPELDSFNPFATKSKIRQTPPRDIDMDNPFSTKSKIKSSPETSLVIPHENSNNSVTIDNENNLSTGSGSSKTSEEKDVTVHEVHTEDEDTLEGPFLEADDGNDGDKMPAVTDDKVDVVDLHNLNQQGNDDAAEMFIDAEAFEFLMNQNKTDEVAYSGKESLFLKFDPLFARRVTSEGVAAALNEMKRKQSTPKKASKPAPPKDIELLSFEKPVSGPSGINKTTPEAQSAVEKPDDLSLTASKPMMAVTPAVNPVATPRKSLTPNRSNRLSMTFTSPAMAVIDRLLSLSGNSPTAGHETTVIHTDRTYNDADQALTQLRELLAEKEINVYNLRCETKELKDRLSTLETQMKALESESAERLQKVNELTENLAEKTKMNRNMAAVVEEYERTIASLISETEQDKKRFAEERNQLIRDRDEQTAHLSSMEVSFNDLHSKYEKSKQVIMGYKNNEEAYKKSLQEFEENLAKMHTNYELLKQHATSKLNHANQELEKINKAHEAEVLKFNAMIKRKELHITSLEESLAQKTKANEELTAICDELINKVG